MGQRRIAVVTGTRAEYGLLFPVMQEMRDDSDLELQVIATGAHLSPEFGLTYKQIEADGFFINAKIEMLLSSDTPAGITKSIGLGVIGFADTLERLRPDMLLVLGDRFEILAAVQAALVARVPVGHIAGGDTTEGAFDESIRHAVTKMAHLHFVTNKIAARRVRQLGEDPRYVFNTGSPGLDALRTLRLLSRDDLAHDLGFVWRTRNLLITFHPVTLESTPAEAQFTIVLQALESLGRDVGLILTKPNADTGGRALIAMIDDFTAAHPNARAYTSLGQQRYLSVMAQADAVVGNSSSGLYEAPSLKVPAVDIGDRQKGRLRASSVLHCPCEAEAITRAILQAFETDCSQTVNPYGDGHSAPRIVAQLKAVEEPQRLLQKHFFDAEESS